MRVAFLRMNDMNMKTLLSLSLLALPFFTAQVNAEPVALAAQTQPASTAVKTIVPITAKTKEQALAQAKVEAARVKEEAVRDIENEKNKAVEELRSEIGTASVRIASKLLKKEVSASSEQEQLVNQYLNEVGGRS